MKCIFCFLRSKKFLLFFECKGKKGKVIFNISGGKLSPRIIYFAVLIKELIGH